MRSDQQFETLAQESISLPGTVRFSIRQWAAWAPGLEDPEAWYRWARGETIIKGEGEPRVAAMPPMLRRRAGRLGRMALETVYASTCGQMMIPTVFCSRHGEVGRTCGMLMALARDDDLSPTTFSMSVHNAVGGLYSIANSSSAPVTAIAGGAASVVGGIIDACGQLADGEAEVLLVMYDEPLPLVYQQYRDESEFAYAWAWRMTPASGESFSLTWGANGDGTAAGPTAAQLGLEILRLFLSRTPEGMIGRGRRTWRWRRHA